MVVMLIKHGAALGAAATLMLAGCGGDDDESTSSGRVSVLAAFYPLAYVAEQVGGDAVTVENLTAPGVEPHDLELTPRQVEDILGADLAIYLKGFQPAVDEAIEQNSPGRVLEVATAVPLDVAAPAEDEHEEGEEEEHAEDEDEDEHGDLAGDPHIWLDPTKVATIASAVAQSLAEVDPDRADDYQDRAADFRTRLEELDADYEGGLASCERHEIVTSHAAFGYLAARYDLEQIPIAGLSPEDEPSPSRIEEVQHEVEEQGITTIFFETLVSPDFADTIARDTGATTAVLDPIEGISDTANSDYFTVMRGNLDALREALACT